MKYEENEVTMTPGELADIIQAHEDEIKRLEIPEKKEAEKAKLKALLYDVRSELVYALRLADVDVDIEAL